MSNLSIEDLNLTMDELKDIVEKCPDELSLVYWHKILKSYYKFGSRHVAQIYCVNRWRTSTRKNTEIEDNERFISMMDLEKLLCQNMGTVE